MSHFEAVIERHGLTVDQYRRAVAAHERAHGLVGTTIPSLDVHSVHLFDDHHGVHGGTATRTARGYATTDPMQHAVELHAGAIAKSRWLKERERCWSSALEQIVYDCAGGDREIIARLGLGGRERSLAQGEAARAVDRQWSGLVKGVSRLVKRGRLDACDLRKLVR